jgi:hypothetical protein
LNCIILFLCHRIKLQGGSREQIHNINISVDWITSFKRNLLRYVRMSPISSSVLQSVQSGMLARSDLQSSVNSSWAGYVNANPAEKLKLNNGIARHREMSFGTFPLNGEHTDTGRRGQLRCHTFKLPLWCHPQSDIIETSKLPST